MTTTLSAADLEAWLRRCERHVSAHAEELTALDAAIGDADHGTNMRRGMAAVVEVLDVSRGEDRGAPMGADVLLKKIGRVLVSTVGGASGPLYGTFFLRMGAAAARLDSLDARGLADAVEAGVAGVAARGRSGTGEKTMLDAWCPAVEALRAHPDDLAVAVEAAATAADAGRDATAAMVATKGRASYLGERSVGHIDPGAASAALILRALAEVVAELTAASGTAAVGEPAAAGEQPEVGESPAGDPAKSAAWGTPLAASDDAGRDRTGVVRDLTGGGEPGEVGGERGVGEAPGAGESGAGGPGGGEPAAGEPGRVCLVLVSHSRALAEAARDLARGLVTGLDVVVEVAAGLSDGSLGTDSATIAAAITRVGAAPGCTGVLVLADLGSAVMSVESALEMIAPELAERTRLSRAPFVEGLVGAYAAAGVGRDLEAVDAEACSGARGSGGASTAS